MAMIIHNISAPRELAAALLTIQRFVQLFVDGGCLCALRVEGFRETGRDMSPCVLNEAG
jgi:hypothetical protein